MIVIFVIKQICWTQGQVMLNKFNEQIGKSFPKIINTKVNLKLCHTAEMELFPQVVTGFRGELRILSYI